MLEPAARLKVISRVKTLVVKYHFNVANIDYADWSRAVDEQIPTLLKADDNVFEEGVRSLLSQLKSSHTNFYSFRYLSDHATARHWRYPPFSDR